MPDQHTTKRTLVEVVHVPDHEKRSETPQYVAIRHRLVHELDTPCWICGVRASTLHDPTQNPAGATQLEAHHRIVEWSLMNAVDLDRFNRRIVARYQAMGKPGYEQDFTQEQLEAWVDHSPENLMILCDQHHRAPGKGVHALTMPIWQVQDLLLDGYQLTEDPEKGRKP